MLCLKIPAGKFDCEHSGQTGRKPQLGDFLWSFYSGLGSRHLGSSLYGLFTCLFTRRIYFYSTCWLRFLLLPENSMQTTVGESALSDARIAGF